jgi:hypothetical protein
MLLLQFLLDCPQGDAEWDRQCRPRGGGVGCSLRLVCVPLLQNESSVHAGVNTRLAGVTMADFETGDQMDFLRIPNDAVDEIGVK